MDLVARYYPETLFGGFTDVDGTIRFFLRVGEIIESRSVVLDVGCGRGEYARDPLPIHRKLRDFRGRCARVIGIDVDPAAATNPWLDEFRLISGKRWPLDDGVIDIAIADWVLEHVTDPGVFFSEAARVVKPGGVFALRTSNVLGYVTWMSRMIPRSLHGWALGISQPRRREEDVFPTVHRCNSTWKLRRALRLHGFDPCVYGYESEPQYLGFSRMVYWLGMLHARHAPSFLRLAILVYARRIL